VSINVAFANASALQNALDCNIALEQNEEKGFSKYLTKQPHNISNIPDADHYIFTGSGILLRIDSSKLKGRKTLIISDSHYLQYTKEIDEIIERENMSVFCMVDLWDFCKFEKKVFIHPFLDFNSLGIKNNMKFDRFSICHSPYKKVETNQKGSSQIRSAVNKFSEEHPCNYFCISDKRWIESVDLKSKCHFFIDQISIGNHYSHIGYQGGIGKSGLEGMLLKCLTFSAGVKMNADIPEAPFIQVENQDDLYDKLLYYKNNTDEAQTLIQKQYEWAKKYTNADYVAYKIMKT
jgi:hypothetical protein